MKVRVLGICGSPRIPSNSEYLLEQALEEAGKVSEEVELKRYSLAGKKFAHCLGCFRCKELKGECVQKDDFQELRDEWLKADVIIYSVPVYHMTMPGQLKCFIDRLGNTLMFSYYGGLAKQAKVIGAIAQGIHIFSGQEHTITDLINHALVMGSIPVAGDLWEAYIGAGGWTSKEPGGDAFKKQHEKGDFFDTEVAIRASKSIGKRTVQIALMLKQGAVVEREMLEREGILFKPLLDRL